MEEKKVRKVIVVAEVKSYLVSALIEKIKETGDEAGWSDPDVNSIHAAMEDCNALLISVSEGIVNDSRALVYIRDKAIESGIPIFLYGDTDELGRTEKVLIGNIIKGVFTRPIDVKQVVDGIRQVLEDYHGGARKKVLVVDDSGAMLRNVKGWLEDKYQVILANSGTMAIKYLATDRPDLVLLDYEMPIINGKQVLEMMRSEADFQDIPVIFLTSNDNRDAIIEVMSLRPSGYLLKTLPPEKIIAEVDNFFEKQKKLG